MLPDHPLLPTRFRVPQSGDVRPVLQLMFAHRNGIMGPYKEVERAMSEAFEFHLDGLRQERNAARFTCGVRQ